MTKFKVIDGDTFHISPEWTWDGKTGKKIKPEGYDIQEKGNPIKLSYGRLLCSVYYRSRNLKSYF